MIYQAGVITALLAWLLDETGSLSRLLPKIVLLGVDIGFYVLHGLLFLLVAVLLILGTNTRFGLSGWMAALASRQGTATVMDVLILGIALLCCIGAISASLISPYLLCALFLAFAGPIESLLSTPAPPSAPDVTVAAHDELDETPLSTG